MLYVMSPVLPRILCQEPGFLCVRPRIRCLSMTLLSYSWRSPLYSFRFYLQWLLVLCGSPSKWGLSAPVVHQVKVNVPFSPSSPYLRGPLLYRLPVKCGSTKVDGPEVTSVLHSFFRLRWIRTTSTEPVLQSPYPTCWEETPHRCLCYLRVVKLYQV